MLLFMFISISLLVVGTIGIFICRKNIIVAIMCIEVMLFSVTFNFICLSAFTGDISGQIFSLFILTISAAESAIGLSLVICYHSNYTNSFFFICD